MPDPFRAEADRIAASRGAAVACRAGCSHCCHQPIGITPHEALVVARYLKDAGRADRALRRRLSAHTARAGVPCPLLDASGSCSVYPARPRACRAWFSTDVAACRASPAPGPHVIVTGLAEARAMAAGAAPASPT